MDQLSKDPQDRRYLVKLLGGGRIVTVRGTRDQRVGAIAAMQRGRVARRQLLAAGISGNVIGRMLANGRLHRLHSGVYAVGHVAPIELGRETAALLAAPDGAYLSHRSAAALWGLLSQMDARAPVDITVVGASAMQRAGIRCHRTSSLDKRDVRIHNGLPVSSPARALLEIASRLGAEELEQALDAGLGNNIVRAEQVRDVLERSGIGRKGAALLRALLDERTARPSTSRSRYERILRRLIRAADLPEPEMNVPLHGYVVDCLWREQRLVVEVDSFRYHGSRASFESDRRRDAVLEAAGWTVVRVTRRQLDHEPYAVIARLAKALVRADIARDAHAA